MARLSVPIVIDGLDMVRDVIQRFLNEAEFKDGVSDDYKKGVYDFGNAIIEALDKRTDRA